MSTSKATARPWRVTIECIIVAADSRHVSCIRGDGSSDEDDANAALIVRAVNSHDALVAALLDLLDGTEPWDERATQARAALALAEQGGG